ncbi:MAG: hydrogenase formation protein HypD [Myxococcales bacterium]|nr:hydrogenase formation protein HypD [Myxococcales bacterium]
MRFVSEFRDPATGKKVLQQIEQQLRQLGHDASHPLKIMEVCGGHTHTIFKFGLEGMLPPSIELVHGPGCPVCVLPVGRLDDAIAIASQPDVIFTTFGDTLRVPGSQKSLLQCKAEGADIRTVYSPTDALSLARQHPQKKVVFFGIGFETTAPATALTLLQAREEAVSNFSVFCNHITIIPTLEAILADPSLRIDGFLGPGHVTMVIGLEPYTFVCDVHKKPFVISGFEPLDVLQSLVMLLEQFRQGRCFVENQYKRLVQPQGNRVAQQAMQTVFEAREHFEWRGLGSIPHSGLRLREAFSAFDAEKHFAIPAQQVADPKACQCGDVLKGAIKPWQCKVFGTACTPETPIGACMVSSEGACAAYYNYGRLSTSRKLEATR